MLYLVGLGMTPDSLTIRAQRILQKCKRIYLDAYTSILISYEEMTQLVKDILNRDDVIQADRNLVENQSDVILENGQNDDIAFLVVGDAMCATTHSDLYLRAVEKNIEVKVLHNASIINVVAATGLEIYKFGRTISVPFFDQYWKPLSFLEKTIVNYQLGMHTLLLMDIKTKELNFDLLRRKGIERYNAPQYMYCNLACQQILFTLGYDRKIVEAKLQAIEKLNESTDSPLYKLLKQFDDLYEGKFEEESRSHQLKIIEQAKQSGFSKDCFAVACQRVGTDDQKFYFQSIEEMAYNSDMGLPLHSLIICGEGVSEMEMKMLQLWKP